MRGRIIGLLIIIMTGILCACGGEKEREKENVSPSAIGAETPEKTLKDVFKDDFSVGVAVNTWQLSSDGDSKLIREHFNSCTMENEMKPESILDLAGSEKSEDGMPAINKEHLKNVLTLASQNGLKLRGHTLIWHNQTPEWFFCKDYEPSKGRVNKKKMLARMESYIRQVITYCEEQYPGIVYAWDVINEGTADEGGFREDSPWYEIIGEEYFEKAFEYARKYAGDNVKLFYNDYNEYEIVKRDFIFAKVKLLAKKGLLDGVGMQSHWTMDYPTVDYIEAAVEKYSSIEGMEVQLTEIDMHCSDNSKEAMREQADRYKEIFQMLLKLDKEGRGNITNVTFWGLNDGVTWLTNFKGETSYPLLFDENNKAKPVLKSLLEIAH